MGLTDSLECRFSWHDQRSVAAAWLDLQRTCMEGAMHSRCCVGLDLRWTSE